MGGGHTPGLVVYPALPMPGGAATASAAVRIPGGGSRIADANGGGAHPLLGILQPRSLPSHLFAFRAEVSCPLCKASVLVSDIETHMLACLSKPRIGYNQEILSSDKGECAICLEELAAGNHVARLPCLCVYHKVCIDAWFQKRCTCPEHPGS